MSIGKIIVYSIVLWGLIALVVAAWKMRLK